VLKGRELILALIVLALVTISCSKTAATTPLVTPGDIVLGAEQEPQCMDWMSSCAGADWGIYMMQTNTMPRAYDYTDSGYQASMLLAGPAVVQTTPQQVVTYQLNPKAVWDDGQPITSHDFKYTWSQIAHGQNIYDRSGYNQIKAVNDSKPDSVVVTFSSPYPHWKMLFGGTYGIFPSHILEGRDRDALMRDGYAFSGGPWKMDHWTKGTEVKLVRNPTFWGKKPILNSVTFQFITNLGDEKEAYKSGQVLGLYPKAEPGVEALKGLPGTYFDAVPGLSYEGLWFNVERAPLNTTAVRQALAYATDRDAIVRRVFGAVQPAIDPINSAFTPAYGDVYNQPFAQYHHDLTKVDQLMTSDGWAKGVDGVWAKDGIKATLELKTTTGSESRQMIVHMVQKQWMDAGFQLAITQESSGTLFGQDLPAGNFSISAYGQSTADDDPSECLIWCSKDIPTRANNYSGQNWTRTNDPGLDKLWLDADSNLDQTARITDARESQLILANIVPVVPLTPVPDILVVNSDRLGVEHGTFQHNFAYGPFTYMNTWYPK
jgi:peptide/nickel transport system substrate-binding protein